ncbi:phosphoribosylglycinamide formyltransferase [Thermostilla marina]
MDIIGGKSGKLPVAVLISGTGRTLKELIHRIHRNTLPLDIRVVISSTPNAKGLQYAEIYNLPIEVIERKDFASDEDFSNALFSVCRGHEVELVVLAGFIRKLNVPEDFRNRVINTHPSLAPAFCGKNYYGNHVHEAVLNSGVKVTGCTVYFLDNTYDMGPVISQHAVPVHDDDTLDTLEPRVFAVECDAFAEALTRIAEKGVTVEGRKVRFRD